MLERATNAINDYFTYLSNQLTGQTYFGGDVFSISDAAVVSHVMGCSARGTLPKEGTNLAKWWELGNFPFYWTCVYVYIRSG